MSVVLMLAEHVHSTSQININPHATAVFVYKRKSYMKIMMMHKLNSVTFATGELHSFCTLVLYKLCIPDFDGVLSTEKYVGYLRKCSIFKHLKTLQLRSDCYWQFYTS
jgi:hypothetical protein